MSNIIKKGGKIILNFPLKNFKKQILVSLIVFAFVLIPQHVRGYPIEDFSSIGLNKANTLSESINSTVKSLWQTSWLRSLSQSSRLPSGASGGLNLINTSSFSRNDIWGSLKAVAILFLQLAITVLGVITGILKIALELLMAKL